MRSLNTNPSKNLVRGPLVGPQGPPKFPWISQILLNLSFLAWRFYGISERKSHNLTPHFLLQFYPSYIFCFSGRSYLWTQTCEKRCQNSVKKQRSYEKQCCRFLDIFCSSCVPILGYFWGEIAKSDTTFPSPVLSKLQFLFWLKVFFMPINMWKTTSKRFKKQRSFEK